MEPSNILKKFPFATSKTVLDIHYKKHSIKVPLAVSEQPKFSNLRKLVKSREVSKLSIDRVEPSPTRQTYPTTKVPTATKPQTREDGNPPRWAPTRHSDYAAMKPTRQTKIIISPPSERLWPLKSPDGN